MSDTTERAAAGALTEQSRRRWSRWGKRASERSGSGAPRKGTAWPSHAGRRFAACGAAGRLSEWDDRRQSGRVASIKRSLAALRHRRRVGDASQLTMLLLARHIVATAQRPPERRANGTASWSLSTLQRTLRKGAYPRIGTSTIRRMLENAGSSYQRTRSWCPTGTAQRVRTAGVVTVVDPKTEEKRG
jgi:hypothetical protein